MKGKVKVKQKIRRGRKRNQETKYGMKEGVIKVRKSYAGCTLNGVKYKVVDDVVLHVSYGDENTKDEVGRIIKFYFDEYKEEQEPMVLVHWFWRASHV